MFALLFVLIGSGPNLLAQAVAVTARLDTNTISLGGSTTLRVFAQVIPALRANSDQIFAWYVDVLNTNGSVASANYAAMQKSSSDNDPKISSIGTNDGPNQRGIFDTFLNLPGAGVANPVELMAIPVTGISTGQTRFIVQAGTTEPLSADFIVGPLNGGDPMIGGDYSAATADLRVVSQTACVTRLQIAPLGGTGPARFLLTFTPCPGGYNTVEYRAALNDRAGWRALPGAPHNSGSVTVTNIGPQQFFRVNTSQTPPLGDLRLNMAALPGPTGNGQRLQITFSTVPAYSYTVEARNDLLPTTAWQALPGAPHNGGTVTVTNTGPPRFFRLRAGPL